MSGNALVRDAIVKALDDLDEREKMADVWTKNADVPYPSKAVHERSQRLRERLEWRRGGFLFLMLLVVVTGGLGTAGWTIPGVLFGFLSGVGGAFVIASIFTDPWAEDHLRALQLYDLLKQIDGEEAVSDSRTSETA